MRCLRFFPSFDPIPRSVFIDCFGNSTRAPRAINTTLLHVGFHAIVALMRIGGRDANLCCYDVGSLPKGSRGSKFAAQKT
jgi:hypothetical protein